MIQGTPSVLEQSMEGKVWEITVSAEDSISLSDRYCISNMKQNGNQYDLRIVNDDCPLQGAKTIHPNLEDVFLYYFGGNRHDAPDTI